MKYVTSEIDLTKDGEPEYTTYFYHKNDHFIWKVITNGTRCALVIRDELKINKDVKFGSSLPKYITNNLI